MVNIRIGLGIRKINKTPAVRFYGHVSPLGTDRLNGNTRLPQENRVLTNLARHSIVSIRIATCIAYLDESSAPVLRLG